MLHLILLTMGFVGFAQAPNLLNYQGVARNAVGNPLPNQTMNLRLSVHNLTASGTTVYTETRVIKTNLGGLFSVQIGSAGTTSATGTIGGVNWLSGDKYLQVEIDPASNNNYLNMGTVQLVSVPYAFSAGTAGNAATVTTNANLSGVVTSIGNATSIANGSITNTMLENGAVVNLSGSNTGDNATNNQYSGLVSNATHTGDVIGATELTVVKINGTLLSGLATGILKNTTATGIPSIAVAGDFPTLNQSTSGNAATVTTNANLTGVVTSIGNTTAIANGAITNAMLSNGAVASLSGTNTGDQTLPTLISLGAVASNAAITGATNTKITYDAKGLVTSGVAASTADIAASNDKNYVTNAQQTLLGNTSGTNTGDNATNNQYSGLVSNATHTGDATGATALTVVKINGTLLSGLATGILKNTTVTGIPSIAVAGDFPTLNQNTTGNAANLSGLTTTVATLNNVSGVNTGDQINITGNAATVTTNANLTGVVTSLGNTTAIANGAITNAMLANGAVANLSGTNTGDQTLPTLISLGAVASNAAITGATNTKISYDEKGLVTAGATATTADIAASTNKNYVTDAQQAIIGNTSGTNTGDNAANSLYSELVSNATHTGDATGSTALTVVKINGTQLSTLATGILKNTTTTGVPSIAVAADFPILNQNTTGTAANITGMVAVANGGTGSTTLTANNVLLGNGTSTLLAVAPGNSGNVLISNGTTWTSASVSAANAETLSGTTLASNVVNSSLTNLGTLSSATISGKVIVGASSAASSSAVLEVNSTTKGFLPPRMTAAQRNAIISPQAGLVVWCSNCSVNGELEVYNGSSWTNTTGGNTAAAFAVGALYGGGIVAYILQPWDPGYDPNVQHGLIASTSNLSEEIRWDNSAKNGALNETGARATAFGQGLSNTNHIIFMQGATATNYAAGLARAHNGGGYTDWYLPTKDELNKLYLNKGAIGGFINKHYWSSSEYNPYSALTQHFWDGSQGNTGAPKDVLDAVRAVRSF